MRLRSPLACLYLGFIIALCGAGAWWGWVNSWDDGSRFASVVTGIGALLTLWVVGEVVFPPPKPKAMPYVVIVVIPGVQTMVLPCPTYEMAFHVALYAQLLGYEKHGLWFSVKINPDRPEKVR